MSSVPGRCLLSGLRTERAEIDVVGGEDVAADALEFHDGFVEVGLCLEFAAAVLREFDLALEHEKRRRFAVVKFALFAGKHLFASLPRDARGMQLRERRLIRLQRITGFGLNAGVHSISLNRSDPLLFLCYRNVGFPGVVAERRAEEYADIVRREFTVEGV